MIKWYWLVVIGISVYGLAQSDAKKRQGWQDSLKDARAPIKERLGECLLLAIAIWQTIVLWRG